MHCNRHRTALLLDDPVVLVVFVHVYRTIDQGFVAPVVLAVVSAHADSVGLVPVVELEPAVAVWLEPAVAAAPAVAAELEPAVGHEPAVGLESAVAAELESVVEIEPVAELELELAVGSVDAAVEVLAAVVVVELGHVVVAVEHASVAVGLAFELELVLEEAWVRLKSESWLRLTLLLLKCQCWESQEQRQG